MGLGGEGKGKGGGVTVQSDNIHIMYRVLTTCRL